MITPKEFFLPFLKKEQVAKGTYAFYFSAEKTPLDFVAGQYMRLTLPIENPDERGASRLFSIASSPLEKDYIMITTKISESLFKKALVNLAPGVEVKFFGPIGRFVLQDETKSYVFLAGGIGITPFHSIINYVSSKNLATPITFFVSFSTTEDMFFYQELTEVSKKHTNIKIVYTITQPENSRPKDNLVQRNHQPSGLKPLDEKPWQGETGRISQDLIKKYISDPFSQIYYIAGPPKMVEAMEQLVKDMGVDPENIRKENFVGY